MNSVTRSLTRSRRLPIGLAAVAALAGAAAAPASSAPAAHGSATVGVVRLLAPRIASVKRHDGGVAVLLPATLPLPTPDFTASSSTRDGYSLEIDGAEPCHAATVCLFALFTGQRGAALHGSRLTLSHDVRGAFTDIRCGASCSPPSIAWIEHGVLYTIAANPSIEPHQGGPGDPLQALFVAAANQAIGAGPR
jgi:hypothetical protein